ncbi:hypothetical protein [Gryllotalpicola koreensis]|uniref:DUF3618 domain-containing protein n=1 Tax=Gryllotalpicola koreensis TaxID=993086 RepID=A0ABP8A1P3_9MICO
MNEEVPSGVLIDLIKDVKAEITGLRADFKNYVTQEVFDLKTKQLENLIDLETKAREAAVLAEANARKDAIKAETSEREQLEDQIVQEKAERKTSRNQMFGALIGAVSVIIAAATLYETWLAH